MKSDFEKLTFEDLLNWLDRPEGATLELYPREVKECREMLTEFKQDLNKVKQELEVYKKAVDWLADRCEMLDEIANPEFASICFKAKRWKEIALQKAREQE